MKNLVIVESPSKSKTIEKYLGKDFKVTSSKGHICDLATKGKEGLGVDIEDDFKPTYVISPDKKKVVTDLKKMVKESDFVYLLFKSRHKVRKADALGRNIYGKSYTVAVSAAYAGELFHGTFYYILIHFHDQIAGFRNRNEFPGTNDFAVGKFHSEKRFKTAENLAAGLKLRLIVKIEVIVLKTFTH